MNSDENSTSSEQLVSGLLHELGMSGKEIPGAEFEIPNSIGPYEISSYLDQGAHGVVYRGLDKVGQEVAVKLLKPGADQGELDRYVEIATALRGIPRILEYGIHEGRIYYARKYYTHGLRYRLKELAFPQPQEEIIRLAEAFTQVLGEFHRNDYVHCDFKPDNLMLDPQATASERSGFNLLLEWEQLVLTDYGTIKDVAATGQDGSGRDEPLLGTKGYAAPEQYKRAATSGPRMDIYAATATLVEATTGQRPRPVRFRSDCAFDDDVFAQTGPLEPVLRRGLSYDPADRQRSMEEWFDELTSAPLLNPEPGNYPSAEGPGSRTRPWSTLAVVATTILALPVLAIGSARTVFNEPDIGDTTELSAKTDSAAQDQTDFGKSVPSTDSTLSAQPSAEQDAVTPAAPNATVSPSLPAGGSSIQPDSSPAETPVRSAQVENTGPVQSDESAGPTLDREDELLAEPTTARLSTTTTAKPATTIQPATTTTVEATNTTTHSTTDQPTTTTTQPTATQPTTTQQAEIPARSLSEKAVGSGQITEVISQVSGLCSQPPSHGTQVTIGGFTFESHHIAVHSRAEPNDTGGFDLAVGGGGPYLIVGSTGGDSIIGTADSEIICGLGGDDDLSSKYGDDIVIGGSGADEIKAFGGANFLVGNSSSRAITGGSDEDWCFGEGTHSTCEHTS